MSAPALNPAGFAALLAWLAAISYSRQQSGDDEQ
jgi:hypothetical protein